MRRKDKRQIEQGEAGVLWFQLAEVFGPDQSASLSKREES
jgi:hypothetical protein